MKTALMVAAVWCGACGTDEPGTDEPAVQGLQWSRLDGSIEQAWGAGRAAPGTVIETTFPLVSEGIDAGTEVRLLAGRSSNDPGYPATTGDDVIIADERFLATASVRDDGSVEFPELTVTDGAWHSESGTVPVELTCGVTVIAARAYARGERASQLLATTWLVVVSAACP